MADLATLLKQTRGAIECMERHITCSDFAPAVDCLVPLLVGDPAVDLGLDPIHPKAARMARRMATLWMGDQCTTYRWRWNEVVSFIMALVGVAVATTHAALVMPQKHRYPRYQQLQPADQERLPPHEERGPAQNQSNQDGYDDSTIIMSRVADNASLFSQNLSPVT